MTRRRRERPKHEDEYMKIVRCPHCGKLTFADEPCYHCDRSNEPFLTLEDFME